MASQVTTATVGTQAAAHATDKRFPGGPPGYDIVAFALDWLAAIHAPPTPTNISAVVGWANAESSGYNPGASGGRNNPFNIVATPGDGSVGQGGSQGNIADFPTPAAGVAATAKFFDGIPGQKATIVGAFRQGAPVSTIEAAVGSFYGQWGAGGFKFAGGGTGGATGVGAGQGGATLTSGIPGVDAVTGALGGILDNVPGLGPLIGAATLPAKLAGVLLGVFANWRYALELFAGTVMIGLGIWLIAKDTGATQFARNRVEQAVGTAAVAA